MMVSTRGSLYVSYCDKCFLSWLSNQLGMADSVPSDPSKHVYESILYESIYGSIDDLIGKSNGKNTDEIKALKRTITNLESKHNLKILEMVHAKEIQIKAKTVKIKEMENQLHVKEVELKKMELRMKDKNKEVEFKEMEL